MCGIAGSVNFQISLQNIKEKMGHRGPDDSGSFTDGNVELFHLRLAILDIAGGAQPMTYLERYTIVFNGEIYNHQDVRRQMGLNCSSSSDTETILHAFHKEGMAMLHRFDGMFAFAIYDKVTQKLFLARDRAGKKPLYLYANGGRLLFASEINALSASIDLAYDHDALAAYLRMGSFFRTHTPFKHVTEVENGGWVTIDIQTLHLQFDRWWQIADQYSAPKANITEPEALEQLDAMLNAAVRCRIESSDLEVGSFLSGGIDSGLVTAMAAQHQQQLKTFTVSFDGAYNEAPLARQVANKYNTAHHEIKIDFSNLPADVEHIIAQYGEPFFDSSAIPSWYVSKAAKAHVTVILNGDGADELFGGYRRYVPFSKFDFFATPTLGRQLSNVLGGLLPIAHEKKSAYNYFYRLVELFGKQNGALYLASWTDIFEGFESQIVPPERQYFAEFETYCKATANRPFTALQRLMCLDFEVNLFDDLLVKMDIATMAASLEGRSPMLCKALLEWVPTLPDNLKINGNTTKYLLRKLAERYLPTDLINQPKRGFEVPLKDWVNGPLNAQIAAALQRTNAYYPTIIRKDFITRLWDRKVRVSDEKRAKMLWTVYCLEVWHQRQRVLV
jgi:asparagine synthase (glutamine-hydrolysing)